MSSKQTKLSHVNLFVNVVLYNIHRRAQNNIYIYLFIIGLDLYNKVKLALPRRLRPRCTGRDPSSPCLSHSFYAPSDQHVFMLRPSNSNPNPNQNPNPKPTSHSHIYNHFLLLLSSRQFHFIQNHTHGHGEACH